MPHVLRSAIVLLLLLLFGSGTTLAQAAGPPVSEVLATGHAASHDDHAPDDHAHGDHAHDDHAHDDHAHDEHADDHDHGDQDHGDQDHDHGHGLQGVRLLVASLAGPELVVLDADDGAVIGRFTVPGIGRVHQLPNPQLAGVVHRDANRVTFVHSGLTVVDHGDHADLLEGSPYVLATVNLGREPAHFFARGHDIAVFNDGDGSMAWLDARLLGVSLDFVEVPGLGPDHGVLAVVDGHLVGGGLNEAAVRVYDRRATQIATFGGCPGLHGQSVQGDVVAFGCSDGVLLVESAGGGVFTAYKIANPPGSPAGARIGTLAADDGSPVLVGSFGQGIALIDPVARTLAPVALPAAPVAMRFAEDGEVLLVLTVDGYLHALDPATGAVAASVRVAHAVAAGQARPSMAVLGEALFVADPEHREIVWVDVDHMEVEARWPLPFVPGSVAAMGIEGAVRH